MVTTNKKNILIVDEDGDIRNLLQHTLEEKGYTVQTAIYGKEGIERQKDTPFDIIIVDIKISIKDGAELLKIAKKFNSEVVAILVARYSSIESAWEAHTYLSDGKGNYTLASRKLGRYRLSGWIKRRDYSYFCPHCKVSRRL